MEVRNEKEGPPLVHGQGNDYGVWYACRQNVCQTRMGRIAIFCGGSMFLSHKECSSIKNPFANILSSGTPDAWAQHGLSMADGKR